MKHVALLMNRLDTAVSILRSLIDICNSDSSASSDLTVSTLDHTERDQN